VVAQTAAVDGLGALLASIKQAGPLMSARMTAMGIKDAVAMALRRPPVMLAIVAAPGELGAMTTPDALPGMKAVAGPDWQEQICAREVLLIGLNRPGRRTAQVRCPMLFVIADHDAVTPPRLTQKAASSAPHRAEVRRYPTGHFDLYVGEWFERASTDMVAFLLAHLGAHRPVGSARI
jgi:pimeloyl-ACP methyl ester carboxylesterase